MSLLSSIREALGKKGLPGGIKEPAKTPTLDEALAKYGTDLNLQNLLQLGAEFKPDNIIDLRRRARFGDPRYLYALYDEMNRLGPAPQISKMRMALKNTQTLWKATPDDFNDDTAEEAEARAARLIRDVCEEAWGKWLPEMKAHHSSKFLYGIQAMQIVVEPRGIENRWERVIDIRPIPARRFRLDTMTRQFLFLPQPTSWTGFPVADLINKGQLFWAEVGRDVEPLDQRGLLFECLIPWAIHQYIVRWRAKRMEIYGLPPRIVSYKPSDPGGKSVAENVAAMLGSVSWAAVPDTMKAELLQIPTGRGTDPYESAIEWCVRTYDQLILGHSQASGVQVGAGSRTSTETAVEMAKDLINARATEFDDDFDNGPLTLYVKRNFGDEWAKTSVPTTESSMIERDDATMLSTVAVNLSKVPGAAKLVDALDVVERCDLKVAEDGEIALDGSVKGEEPEAPPAQPMLVPPGHQVVGPDGKAIPGAPKPTQLPAQPPQFQKALPPGKQQQPGEKPIPAGQLPAGKQQPKAAEQPAAGKGKQEPPPKKAAKLGVPIGPTAIAARSLLAKKRRRQEIITRRQRFASAFSVTKPRVHITSFGYKHGAPENVDALIDVRSLTPVEGPYPRERTGQDSTIAKTLTDHPRTHIVMGGVKTAALRAISAAQMTGASECRLGVGCEHGRHRAVYAANRLGKELVMAGHDVTVDHRDAFMHEELLERLPGAEVFDVHDVSDEARVPAGQPGGGRWTKGGEAPGLGQSEGLRHGQQGEVFPVAGGALASGPLPPAQIPAGTRLPPGISIDYAGITHYQRNGRDYVAFLHYAKRPDGSPGLYLTSKPKPNMGLGFRRKQDAVAQIKRTHEVMGVEADSEMFKVIVAHDHGPRVRKAEQRIAALMARRLDRQKSKVLHA